eukprot:2213684-Lingulodinium_polyedra.AAC.1
MDKRKPNKLKCEEPTESKPGLGPDPSGAGTKMMRCTRGIETTNIKSAGVKFQPCTMNQRDYGVC